MCGFTAVVNLSNKSVKNKSKLLLNHLKFRGNDSQSQYHDDDISLFSSRLSINDHSNGNQPMFDYTKNYIIVLSGEVFNFKELKKDLTIKGYKFKNKSDTEVLLNLYIHYGENCVKKINGFFSFFIWSKKTKEFFVGRDRLGKKPLFWFRDKEYICFSNTIATFKIFRSFSFKKINQVSMINFIEFGDCFLNQGYYFDQVNNFPRSSTLRAKKKNNYNIKTKKYWQIDFTKRKINIKKALKEYEKILIKSIKYRLVGDTNVSLAISSGVDSNSIYQTIIKNNLGKIKLISADAYRKKNFGTDIYNHNLKNITYVKVDYKNYIKNYVKYLNYFDVPNNQTNINCYQELFKNSSTKGKILLLGHGADEIFFGYKGDEKLFKLNQIFQYLRSIKLVNINSIFWLYFYFIFLKYKLFYKVDIEFGKYNKNLKIFLNDFKKSKAQDIYDLKFYLNIFLKSTNSNYVIPDVLGLRYNLETRCPFLDHKMVEFAASLPIKHKIKDSNHLNNKFLCKKYLSKYIAKEKIFLDKKGFGWNLNYHSIFSENIKSLTKMFNSNKLNLIKKSKITKILNYFNDFDFKGKHPKKSYSKIFYNGFALINWLKRYDN